MRGHHSLRDRSSYRSVCVARSAAWQLPGEVFVLVVLLLLLDAQRVHAQKPSDQCEYGKIITSQAATVVRDQVTLQPGPLFSGSGSFEEKPVDTPCDPGQEYGPYFVDAGGTLVARLTGAPPAPNQWSLQNYGVGLTIIYEPLLGSGQYGPGQEVVSFAIPAEQGAAERGGSWPGPGRLRAYIGAPWGTGPLTGSCFGQSYSVEVEITEVAVALPAYPGMTIREGDRIRTDGAGWAFLAGSTTGLGPNTEVAFQSMRGTPGRPPTGPDFTPLYSQAAELAQAGYPMPAGYHADPAAFWSAYSYADLDEAYRRMAAQSNPCEAAVELKLFLESKQNIVAQTGARGYDWAVDNLSIWLLPNEFNALESLFKLASTPVPGLGAAANAKNVVLSVERTLVEIAQYAESQRAAQALAIFTDSRAMSAQAVTARLQLLDGEIRGLLGRIRTAESDMRAANAKLQVDLKLFELGCLGPIPPDRCMVPLQQYAEGARTARFRFLAETTPLTRRMADLAVERNTLRDYRVPLLDGNCDELRQQLPAPASPSLQEQICRNRGWKLMVGKGLLHVYKEKHPWLEPAVYLVNDWLLAPDGTEFIIENFGDTALVSVLDGALNLTDPTGEVLRVVAGEQIALPTGEISALVPQAPRRWGGLLLREIDLSSDIPAPYGIIHLRAGDDALPADWLWQEPDINLTGSGDATLEIVDETTLRVTVPHDNDLWGDRADAPRLLHKVSGDFDLEADMLMTSAATHLAYSEFLLYTPDVPVGYLHEQMKLDTPAANYLILGGGWARAEGLNKLRVFNQPLREGVTAPDTPVRVKLTRRGALFRTNWSLDGGTTWTLASRTILDVPETLWVGWVFKRIAADGLLNEAAVTTLRDIRLASAPLGLLSNEDWDRMGPGTLVALGTDFIMQQAGDEQAYLIAYSPWALAGDFELIVAFDAAPLVAAVGQARYVEVAVGDNSGANLAYVNHSALPGQERMLADMSINNTWYRWRETPVQNASGRIRLVRADGVINGDFWLDGDWVRLGNWTDGFNAPVFIRLLLGWTSPVPVPQTARFTVEYLKTAAGVLIEPLPLTVDEIAAALMPETTPVPAAHTQPGETSTAVPQPLPPPPPATTPTPTPAPILTGDQRLESAYVFDDFSSDALGWSVRDNESATTGYADATYTMRVKQPTFWIMSKIPGDFAPVLVEFDATVLPGSADGMYGVICHYRNGDNYDFVSVNPETLGVAAGRMAAGSFEFLSSGPGGVIEQPAKHLVRDINATNRVRIICLPDRLEVALNGEAEGSWALEPPADGGNAALFVYGFGPMQTGAYTVAFDNLAAWRDAPSAAAAQCEIPVDPAIAPQWDMARLGCPTKAATQSWASVQAFEHGLMLWREDVTLLLYTFADGDGWEFHWDEWYKGAVLPDRGVPPPGLQAPLFNFGYLWATNDQVFNDLGWARWEESSMCATIQSFEHGFVVLRSTAPSCNGRPNPPASGWFGSVEATYDGAWR